MPWNDPDIHWMKPAIALAREGEAALGKNPIGCVIVCDGQAMGEACNEVDVRHDATAHAEFSRWAKIGRIVYGADREDVHEMYFEDRHLHTVDFIRDAYKDGLSLEGGLMAKECAALYVPPGTGIPKDEQFNR